MSQDPYASPQAELKAPSGRWPGQVKYILGNEGAERFSYYGMKGILAAYLTSVLLMTKDQASSIIHLFGFVNYFMPVLGAWVSDRFWGRYKTILWVSLFYCLGHAVLACNDLTESINAKTMLLYAGLGLIAFGSGGIKPCVSAFMGDQFGPSQRHLLNKAYAAFYWMINLGSAAAFLIIPWVRDTSGYSWAFGIPGIAMGVATLIFYMGTKHYEQVPPTGDPAWRSKLVWLLTVLGAITGLVVVNVNAPGAYDACLWGALGAFVLAAAVWTHGMIRSVNTAAQPVELSAFSVWWYAFLNWIGSGFKNFGAGARQRFTAVAMDQGMAYGRILSIFALIPVFWALFDQTFSTWVMQGGQMANYNLFGYEIGAEQMLSANPFMVLILVPFTTLVLYPALGKLATPLRRMSAGMFLAALSFVIVAWLQRRLEGGETLSILWQLLPYMVLTMAEVLISTTGLEFAFTQAPKAMKSTITGYWQLTVAVGNLLVVYITAALGGGHGDESVTSGRFMLYAELTAVVAVIFSVIAIFYKYRRPEDDHAAGAAA
jgi:POT family proton-dependent oligopeptide transporter